MQMNVFSFKGADVRTVMVDGAPWWIAKDVCEVLDLDTTQTRRVDDEDKALRNVQTPGGQQAMLALNESGLYALILRSRKPEAKAFKRWVTSEVLPAIRRTGVYVSPMTEVATSAHGGEPPAWAQQVMAMLAQNVQVLTGRTTEVAEKVAEVHAMATEALDELESLTKYTQTRTDLHAREMEQLKAELADRDVIKRQQLRGEVESIKRQVFKEMTRRGVGVQKVAHDFWEGVKGRAGVTSVRVESLTVSMAQRLFVEAQRQATMWGVSIVVNLPLDLQDAS